MRSDPNDRPAAGLLAGDLVGDRFRIESTVGVGGMATVYRARDEALGRTVALKVFRSELADADDVRRQRDEVQLLASLNAPGLVTLFDAVAEGGVGDHGRAFLVLEFVDGVDLRTRLLDGTPDSPFIARIGADVASALSYIHARGVVHRDVKPGNILLPHDHSTPGAPLAKLADFGIARLLDDARRTATGTVIGTASYLSPEQAQGVVVGTASDLYSLGLVLLESVTGQRAFPGTAIESVLARLARDPDVPQTLDAPWRDLLTAMTLREARDRPDAATVAATLAGPAFLEPTGEATTVPATRLLETDLPPTELLAAELPPTELLSADLPPTELLAPTGLEPTRLMPAPGDLAPTAVFEPADPGTAMPAPRRRRLVLVGATVVAAAVVIVLAVALSPRGTPGPAASDTPSTTAPAAPVVAYPEVPGPLGEHLRQLQRSVAP